MDFTSFKPLLAEASQKLVALTMRTQLAAQPPELDKVMACLEDGSIDPGDVQQVTQGLLKIITDLPEYQAVVEFTRSKRKEYSAMYKQLGEASDGDYTKFLELNEQIAVEIMTEALLKMLVDAGALVDKRAS
jgi:hypothetical protein